MSFKNAVHTHGGTEVEKVAAARLICTREIPGGTVGDFLRAVMRGGGHEGVLGTILSFV